MTTNTITSKKQNITSESANDRMSILTKEQRQQLRAHWRKFINDGKHKSTIWGTSLKKSRLTAAHHLLYNALTKVNYLDGYTPVTNRNKLANNCPDYMGGPYCAMKYNSWSLRQLLSESKLMEYRSRSELRKTLEETAKAWGRSVSEEQVDRAVLKERARRELFEPFGGVLSPAAIEKAVDIITNDIDAFLQQVRQNG